MKVSELFNENFVTNNPFWLDLAKNQVGWTAQTQRLVSTMRMRGFSDDEIAKVAGVTGNSRALLGANSPRPKTFSDSWTVATPAKKSKTKRKVAGIPVFEGKRPEWRDSDAPDAEGRFRDLSVEDLAKWLIKTRKKDLKRINGALVQQIVFNRKSDPSYAKKMKSVQREVRKQLGREDLL